MVKTHNEIPKTQKNAIIARIEATVKKYGYNNFRLIANKYISDNREQNKLQKQIKEAEQELQKLKKKMVQK